MDTIHFTAPLLGLTRYQESLWPRGIVVCGTGLLVLGLLVVVLLRPPHQGRFVAAFGASLLPLMAGLAETCVHFALMFEHNGPRGFFDSPAGLYAHLLYSLRLGTWMTVVLLFCTLIVAGLKSSFSHDRDAGGRHDGGGP